MNCWKENLLIQISEKNSQIQNRPKLLLKRLIASVRCDMDKGKKELEELLHNG